MTSRSRILLLATSVALISILIFFFRPAKLPENFYYRLPILDKPNALEQELTTAQALVTANPRNNQDLNQLAELYYARGRRNGDLADFNLALEIAQKSFAILPEGNSQARIISGRVLATQHRFTEAIELAKIALQESPSSSSAYGVLIPSYIALGRLPDAIDAADRLVDSSPRIENLALRGLVLLALGRDTEAVFEFEKGLSVEDLGESADSAWTRSLLARYFLNRHRLKEASTLLAEALRISPIYHMALDLQGQLLVLKGRLQDADSSFSRAFSQSHQAVYLRHSAELAELEGDHQLALERWQQAEKLVRLELNKDLYGHKLELARILLDRRNNGDVIEAMTLAESEIKVRPSAETFYVWAQTLAANEQWRQALLAQRHCLNQGAQDPAYDQLASLIYQHLGNTSRSKLYSDLAQNLAPKFNGKYHFR